MYGYYDKDGKPLADVLAWAKLFEDMEYKRVAETTLKDGKWVSTVWLGSNHRFIGKGPPLIFETMVFPKKNEWGELDMKRYSTLDAAKRGHRAMVKKWGG